MRHDAKSDWDAMNNITVRTVLALFRCRNDIWETDHRVVEQHGLTWAQFLTLVVLRDAPKPRRALPTQLYEIVQITSGGMTKVLSELEVKGHITRVTNPDDRRGQYAQITGDGCGKVEEIVGELQSVNEDIFSNALSSSEMETLFALLGKLSSSLD